MKHWQQREAPGQSSLTGESRLFKLRQHRPRTNRRARNTSNRNHSRGQAQPMSPKLAPHCGRSLLGVLRGQRMQTRVPVTRARFLEAETVVGARFARGGNTKDDAWNCGRSTSSNFQMPKPFQTAGVRDHSEKPAQESEIAVGLQGV